jgi:hypothetical protein
MKAIFTAVLAALLVVPASAQAHNERETEFPDGSGKRSELSITG